MVHQICVKVGSHWVDRGLVSLSNKFEIREKQFQQLDTDLRTSGFPIYQLAFPGLISNAEYANKMFSRYIPCIPPTNPSPRGPLPVLR